MPLVTQAGFAPVEPVDFIAATELAAAEKAATSLAVDLANDVDPATLVPKLGQISLIRVDFPSAADGRGFSIGRRLRDLGFKGRLRAKGHVISDQFRYALDCGFDEVEIDTALAARQPEEHWRESIEPTGNYRQKLKGRLAVETAGNTDGAAANPAPALNTARTSDAVTSDAVTSDAVRTSASAAATATEAPAFKIPNGVFAETVTQVRHYTDTLFSFRITRPKSFRFRSGEFVMIGLPNAEKPVFRAYSIATPAWDDELEFYSIKVPNGPLTEHLQKIVEGDTVLLRKKSTGTLVLDALTPAKRLYMFSTGTGFAPFASLIRDPEAYEKFDEVIVTHTTRLKAELDYSRDLVQATLSDPLVGEFADGKLRSIATTTREDSEQTGRITTLIESRKLFEWLGVPKLNPETDRAMICGSMEMVQDTKALLEGFGFSEGSNSKPGEFVLERAFVD